MNPFTFKFCFPQPPLDLELTCRNRSKRFNNKSINEMEVKKGHRVSKMIEEDKREKVDLSGLSLDSLPNPSLNVTLISKLDLSNNNLESIPESLTARLLNVVVLDVHSNQLKSLPNSIGCLSKLKVLNISGNLLHSLPTTLENCRSLEEVNANFNKLTKLPDTIGFELINLKKLLINSNKLVYLPHSTSHMTNLRLLDARLNCLRSLPEGLENLMNLEVLNLSQNFQYLEVLPYSIGLLISLIELDVSYNKISTLPDSIGCLNKLQKLRVEGNPLVSPPLEMVMEQSLQVVKEYLRENINRDVKTKKKGSLLRKLVKWGTFNGHIMTTMMMNEREERDQFFSMSDYRSIDGFASPRYMGMFSPRRLFSPRHSR